MALPEFTAEGALPEGIHPATLAEVVERFGRWTAQRRTIASRLERVFSVAVTTGQLVRFVVFGSFVTAVAHPNDVDVFMLVEDGFTIGTQGIEARLLFIHQSAEVHFGATVFWMYRSAAEGDEDGLLAQWQIGRDLAQHGIVEIVRSES